MITLGALAIAFALIRIFVFKMPESPRYLLSRGRDAEAVEAVNYVARYNGKPETLTLDMLKAIDDAQSGSPTRVEQGGDATSGEPKAPLSYKQIITENFKDYSSHSYRKLFAGRKMARHSLVVFLIWLTIGVAYPLYFAFITSYLQTKTTYSVTNTLNHTYMVYCIVSVVGVVGPIAAGFSVETRLGRRWMMALSAVLTGVFLFAYTSVGTEAADIGFQCATAILGNFGESYVSHLAQCLETDLLFFRIRDHVRIHSRVVPSASPRYGDRNCCNPAACRWTGSIFHFDLLRLLGGPHLCECGAVDRGWLFLLGVAIRNPRPCLHLSTRITGVSSVVRYLNVVYLILCRGRKFKNHHAFICSSQILNLLCLGLPRNGK